MTLDVPTEWSDPASLDLDDGEAHVWRVRIPPGSIDAAREFLSADEMDRARRFAHDRDRAVFIHARAALRRILAAYLRTSPKSLQYLTSPRGKPSLTPPAAGLDFNLSHARGMALVAVATSAVGVDVEPVDPAIQYLDLADRVFSPAERQELRALPPGEAIRGFFNAWTRKEAYLKATGDGVAHGLHHFDVSLAPDAPAALLADRRAIDAPGEWLIAALPLGDGYAGALAATRRVGRVRLYNYDSVHPPFLTAP